MHANPSPRNLLLSLGLKGLRAEIVHQAKDVTSHHDRIAITLNPNYGFLIRLVPDAAVEFSRAILEQTGRSVAVTIQAPRLPTLESGNAPQERPADVAEAIETLQGWLSALAAGFEESHSLYLVALGTILRSNEHAFCELIFEQICVASKNRAGVPELIAEAARRGHSL